jgi:pantoate--beta-alanine ligase
MTRLANTTLRRLAIVGRGRVGSALARAFADAGIEVEGPLARGEEAAAGVVLLCVPDSEIANAAAHVDARWIGHVSGATPLDALAVPGARGRELFGLHPLQTVTGPETDFAGCGCAIAGSTPQAVELARELALAVRMEPFEIDDSARAAYHAAASTASNFVVTLEWMAERIAAAAGIVAEDARRMLAPLVRQTVQNWAARGPSDALTGPIARGDELTVARQRAAVADAAPDLLPVFDALADATRSLVNAREPGPATGRRPLEKAGGRLRTIRTIAELRAELAQAPRPVGLVPTMGYFHDGHLSLMRAARAANATVVVSLFVNPAQFGPNEDLNAYPRDEQRDLRLAEAEGVDIVFAPPVEEVYPDGFATTVEVAGLTEPLDGAARPGHFKGVTTVVTKLLNMVGPDVAYFGQKDAQQALVIRRLVRDLNMPVEIEVCPTVREPSGLALSSRNAYLSADERERALALSRALRAAEQLVARGELGAAAVIAAARQELDEAGVEPEYLELRSATDLSPADRVNGSTLLAVAARIGRARLIDNTLLKGADA